MLNALLILLSAAMFFLLPWYYTDSGNLQPVDIAILSIFMVFFLLKLPNLKALINHSTLFKSFLIFSCYSIIVMLGDLILNENDIILTAIMLNLYYVVLVCTFLLMIFYFYQHYSNPNFYRIILFFLLLDTIVPCAFALKSGIVMARINLSFNNPNQLGFFALVNFSLFMYITLWAKEQKLVISKLVSLAIININILFIFLSASRACIPVIILYVWSYFLLFKIRAKGYVAWLVGVGCVIVGAIAIYHIGQKLYLHLVSTRLSMLPSSYQGLSDDIYFRAVRGIGENFENLGYFLFGAMTYGMSARGTLEFHNNFIALFHQFGLVGVFLYLFMNLIALKELYKKGLAYLLPYFCYLFYSMFQYSYRTRVNWLLLTIVIFIIMCDKITSAYGKSKKAVKGFQ